MLLNIDELKVGDKVGIQPTYGHAFTGVVAKVNKNSVVVDSNGKKRMFAKSGRLFGDSSSYRATRLTTYANGRNGEVAKEIEDAFANFAAVKPVPLRPIADAEYTKLMEIVNSIPRANQEAT